MTIVVFRVDANEKLGTGHLMRCLTLANELKTYIPEIHFICRTSEFNIYNAVNKHGFILHSIDDNIASQEQDAQQTSEVIKSLKDKPTWLIVDHYDLSFLFECKIRAIVKKIMVVDDFANRKHDCDLLLDQNLFPVERYKALVPLNCMQLIGTKYALLRNEFILKRSKVNRSFTKLNHIFINFGGGDDRGLIEKSVLAILMQSSNDIHCDVILGQANPNREYLMGFLAPFSNITVYTHVNNIAELMIKADLAIGSGGSTIWERCCLGLPSIVIAVSDIEEQLSTFCAKQNLICYLGRYEQISIGDINQKIEYLLKNIEKLNQMSVNGMNIVDGLGANSVVKEMLAISHE